MSKQINHKLYNKCTSTTCKPFAGSSVGDSCPCFKVYQLQMHHLQGELRDPRKDYDNLKTILESGKLTEEEYEKELKSRLRE
jgi:hypothetical protein